MSEFDNDQKILKPSLKNQLTKLVNLCAEACANDDPKLFYQALKLLASIEFKLWSYYMEVYNKK